MLLILVGAIGLHSGLKEKIHSHEHNHFGIRHSHIHSHFSLSKSAHNNHQHSHAALGIGLLHGTAGGTHLWILLPTLTISRLDGLSLYLSAYTLGTIASMMIFTTTIGHLAQILKHQNQQWGHRFGLVCCSGTLFIGCYWLLVV